MVKMKWDNIDESEIDDWEDDGSQYPQYDGPEPKKGLYRFDIRLERTQSSGGHPQLIAHLTLNPHRAEHRQYKGFYMRDYIIVEDNTTFRYAPLCRALGVTGREFKMQMDVTKTDKEYQEDVPVYSVDKIGKLKFPTQILGNIYKKRGEEYFNIRYVPGVGELGSGDESGNDDADNDTNGEDAPF